VDWNIVSPASLHHNADVGLGSLSAPATATADFHPNFDTFDIPDVTDDQQVTSEQYNAALALMNNGNNHQQITYANDLAFAPPQPRPSLTHHQVRHSISGPVTDELPFGSDPALSLGSAAVPDRAVENTAPEHPGTRVINFGSDASFNSTLGFLPPPNTGSHVDVQRRLVDDMNAMGHRESAPSTRATSPVLKRQRFPVPHESEAESSQESDDDDEEHARPRAKRRRRSGKQDLPSPPPLKTMPRRKSYSHPKRNNRNSGSGDGGKGTKQQKENLSEEQKRNNHIMSEQKRRNIIKTGYEQLNILVPALRDGSFSKSQALMESASYLESLVEGNKRLREILSGADSS
jgi:hypothetical protein